MANSKRLNHLIVDFIFIIVSIVVAAILARNGVLENIVNSTIELEIIGSLIAGIFFTSIFTVAPAAVVLVGFAQNYNPLAVAVLGGLGALIGDFVIFYFTRENLSKDISYLGTHTGLKKFTAVFKLKLFRRILPFIGALIIASPLPDEPGLALMGLSKIKKWQFAILVFLLNSAGIFIISALAS